MKLSMRLIQTYWRKPLSRLWVAGAMGGLFAQANADSGILDSKYYEISSIQVGVKDIDGLSGNVIEDRGVHSYSLKAWNRQQELQQQNRIALLKKFEALNELGEGVSIAQIINFGAKLWKLVEAGKPVVAVTTVNANALPEDTNGNWLALENWQVPRGRIYSITYKNLYGIEVVNFDYRLLFTPGGSFDGKGQYLSNVSVNPQNLAVAWGYNMESTAKVVNVINVGSKANPLAGIELLVDWKVKTVLKDMRSSTSFFVQGDGSFVDLNGSN